MAAGFTLRIEREADFRQFLREYIESSVKEKKIVPVLNIDAMIDITGITPELIKTMQVLEPFGSANEEPRFAITNAKLTGSDEVGGGNIRCYFSSDNGKGISAICYKAAGTEMGEVLMSRQGERFKVAEKIRANEYNGRRYVQLVIDDIAA
jgi:single-stranded-DNA-specific exonuclease